MKLLLLGATGGTGRACLDRALSRGHEIVALVRRPAALTAVHPALTVVGGDPLDGADIAANAADVDAVISALGTGSSLSPTTLYSRSANAIVEGLNAAGVKRLAVVSSGGTVDDPDVALWYKFLKKTILRHLYRDMRVMEDRIHASDLDWTVVRPAYLTDGEHTGAYRTAVERSAPTRGFRIARADVADLLVDTVENGTNVRQNVAIAY